MTMIDEGLLIDLGGIPAPEPGVYHGTYSFDEYTEIRALNQSTLKHFVRSAKDGVFELEQNDGESTPDALLGNALHAKILEPERYARDAVDADIAPGAVWKTHKAMRDKILANEESEIEDPILIRRGWKAQIEGMEQAIRESEFTRFVLNEGYDKRETTLVWHERFVIGGEEYTVPCKGRLDLVVPEMPEPIHHAAGFDIKTTGDATFGGFQRTYGDMGYHRQAGFYLRGMQRTGLVQYAHSSAFAYIVVEKKPPHHVAVYTPTDTDVRQGIAEMKRAATAFLRWKINGEAPGIPGAPRIMQLAPWHTSDEDHRVDINGETL